MSYTLLKAGGVRAESVIFPDGGVRHCIWIPDLPDEYSGPTIVFDPNLLDDIIEIAQQLKTARPDPYVPGEPDSVSQANDVDSGA